MTPLKHALRLALGRRLPTVDGRISGTATDVPWPRSATVLLAARADDALHVGRARVVWRREDDDVAAGGLRGGGSADARERDTCAEDRLVHEEKVACQQRVLHASSRNAKRLDQERSNDEEEAECYEERLRPLPGDLTGAALMIFAGLVQAVRAGNVAVANALEK